MRELYILNELMIERERELNCSIRCYSFLSCANESKCVCVNAYTVRFGFVRIALPSALFFFVVVVELVEKAEGHRQNNERAALVLL